MSRTSFFHQWLVADDSVQEDSCVWNSWLVSAPPFFCPSIRILLLCFQILQWGMKRIWVSAKPRWEFKRQHAMLLLPSESWSNFLCLFFTLINKSKRKENKTVEANNSPQRYFSLSKGGYRFIHSANNLLILKKKKNLRQYPCSLFWCETLLYISLYLLLYL